MKFDSIGDVGAPCGNPFRKVTICAQMVAAAAPISKGGFMNKPRIRPKLIEGKKPSKSMLRTHRWPVCDAAFDVTPRFSMKPCALGCGR